ncbi:c-type cytochrome [Sphingomonas jaspsi]|uniref:c-type cytochrome n=1 Tax=Sphingomonas jaspsi TaxID=392409 RepID=UPI0004B800E5|nr:cytochrome c family protein [Sphingomonas jaspsi]
MRTYWRIFGVAAATTLLAACGGGGSEQQASTNTSETPAATDANATAAPAAPAATPAAAPTADSTDTIDGTKLADLTGDAAHGKVIFTQCQACHAIEEGVNKIGPSLAGVVGRHSGSVAGYAYSAANKNSGITWTPEKLYQYLENPQRVVPGTKMAFAGLSKGQDRADVIAYLKTGGK